MSIDQLNIDIQLIEKITNDETFAEATVVEAFIEEFSIHDVSSCRDAYMGHYRSGAEFAEQMASDCGEVMNPMASWIEIDWEKSWENLSYDYTEYDGHIFSQYY